VTKKSLERLGVVGKITAGTDLLLGGFLEAFPAGSAPRHIACLPEDIEAVSPLVDGWLLLHFDSERQIPLLRKHGGPVVGRSLEYPDFGIPVVLMGDERVGELAAEHLLEDRAGDMVFIGVEATFSRRRWNGFESVCRTRGRAARALTMGAFDMGEMMEDLPAGSGVFAMNDGFARQAMNEALRRGRSVPGDLAFVGVDNAPLPDGGPCIPLSTAPLPLRELGRALGALMLDLLEGNHPPIRRDVNPDRLIVRASSRATG
jgi:DNA-binding LacI/PurR family transcriptional regulator